jgi:hypothetical protein
MPDEEPKRLEFFCDCISQEAADAEGGRVYYYKLDEPPQALLTMWARLLEKGKWSGYWREYLSTKFAALTAFIREPGAPTEEIMERLGSSPSYLATFESWRARSATESKVYRLRVEQIGDRDAVKRAWYDEIETFDEWATACLEGFDLEQPPSGATRPLPRADLAAVVEAAVSAEGADRDAREGLSLLRETRDAVVGRLREGSEENLYIVGTGATSPVDDLALEIAAMTLRLASERKPQLQTHIHGLAEIIKANFDASVVDFLLLRRHEHVEELEFLTTTAEVSTEQRKELEREASYTRPVGITGAVLIAQHDHEMFHVGTNHLEGDPRQSSAHRSAYEELYGKVQNFWVFPLHVGDVLIGALRVVNRRDGGEVVAWPFLIRRRLVGLMKFVGALWQVCDLEAPIDGAEAPPEHVAQALREGEEASLSAVEALVAGTESGMTGATLESVLAGLGSLSEVRIEDEDLRASALLLSPEQLFEAARGLPAGRFIPFSRMPSLSDLDAASTEDGNVLVIRTDGRIMGRVRGRTSEEIDPLKLAAHLRSELTLRFPEGRQRVIEIWKRGAHVADYAFVVRAGLWRVRRFSAAIEALERQSKFSPELLENLVRKVMRLSYDHGAVVVIADQQSLPRPIAPRAKRKKIALADLSEARFDEYAGKDGGCVVTADSVLRAAKVNFPVMPPDLADEETLANFEESRRQLEASLRGTRHSGALGASTHLPEAVVLCASENRTVCAFQNGRTILWEH